MGPIRGAEMDAHLRAGGTVVTASDRAARAILAAFHRARRAEGLQAWPTPRVLPWQSFVRLAWEEHAPDVRLVLNQNQERSLWEQVIQNSGESAAHLAGPRRNLASLATRAHSLLCSYAPRYLEAKARAAWDQDAAVFSRWLSAFDALCREHDTIGPARLALDTIALLKSHTDTRAPLLLAGFDRLLPVHHQLLEAWGDWSQITQGEQTATARFFAAADPAQELAACANWCRHRLTSAPESTILVITQDLQQRRGEFERAFLADARPDSPPAFEFSLGVPLSSTDAVRSALMLLHWLDGDLAEQELDWLFSTPYATTTASETSALRAVMRALRRRGLQRPHWALDTFLSSRVTAPLPEQWKHRIVTAHSHLKSLARRTQSPLEWAEAVPHLLDTIGWPGAFAATSAEFQVIRRWQHALDISASLAFDRRQISWQDFLSELKSITGETLFAPESEGAPILIAGPAESAGLTADAIWFLGAEEDAWPSRGELHPLLPIDVQRQFEMPHSTAQLDRDLAGSITRRLLTSAPEVNFSYPHQREGVDSRPSRLIRELAVPPAPLAEELLPARNPLLLTQTFNDTAAIPIPPLNPADHAAPVHLRGGAGLLTAQSQCAFKAFATARLAASRWDLAESALTAAERGKLLHAVLHSVWAGPPQGVRTLEELLALPDLEQFVRAHVASKMPGCLPPRARDQMPQQYLELEEARLVRLVTEWLAYEKNRADFCVTGTELDAPRTIAGLSLDLRLDRLDMLNDGTILVIDYKTGADSPTSWELPRPDNVQLPLYAAFGLDQSQQIGGLVFAKARPGEICFEGRVRNARATLDPALYGSTSLVKQPLTDKQLDDWRDAIEQLARDFVAGRADVDPRDPSDTCRNCGLQTICRIQQLESFVVEAEEAADE